MTTCSPVRLPRQLTIRVRASVMLRAERARVHLDVPVGQRPR